MEALILHDYHSGFWINLAHSCLLAAIQIFTYISDFAAGWVSESARKDRVMLSKPPKAKIHGAGRDSFIHKFVISQLIEAEHKVQIHTEHRP